MSLKNLPFVAAAPPAYMPLPTAAAPAAVALPIAATALYAPAPAKAPALYVPFAKAPGAATMAAINPPAPPRPSLASRPGEEIEARLPDYYAFT